MKNIEDIDTESLFSRKSHKIGIIFLRSSITSCVQNDKIYPLAQRCLFSIFWLVRNIMIGPDFAPKNILSQILYVTMNNETLGTMKINFSRKLRLKFDLCIRSDGNCIC